MKYVVCLFFMFVLNAFSQGNIITEFARKGSLYDSIETNLRYTEFKKGKKCEVIEFVGILYGESLFKIKYEKWTGIVFLEDLVINDEIQKLINQYKEKKRKETEARSLESENRLQIVKQEIAQRKKEKEENKLREEKNNFLKYKKLDSLNKIEEELQRLDLRNNCHYSTNEIDQFDNIKVIRTIEYWVDGNLTVELYKKGKSKYVFFNLFSDLGCASSYSNDKSFVKVKLENNDIITLYHSWDIDCSSFKLKSRLSNDDILRLKKSKIKSMRFQGTKYYHDISGIAYKEFFIEKLKCLDN